MQAARPGQQVLPVDLTVSAVERVMQRAAKQGVETCAWQLARSEETAQAGP